jgi:hypothetical protein
MGGSPSTISHVPLGTPGGSLTTLGARSPYFSELCPTQPAVRSHDCPRISAKVWHVCITSLNGTFFDLQHGIRSSHLNRITPSFLPHFCILVPVLAQEQSRGTRTSMIVFGPNSAMSAHWTRAVVPNAGRPKPQINRVKRDFSQPAFDQTHIRQPRAARTRE